MGLLDLHSWVAYKNPIARIYRKRSKYQTLELLVEPDGSVSFTLDNHWQFNSKDERDYHENLVGPALVSAPDISQVLILGGGDGLALRSALQFPQVKRVTLVELDPAVLRLAKIHPVMRALNKDALLSPRVRIIAQDARVWLQEAPAGLIGAALLDFPDESTLGAGPLFRADFYAQVKRVLRPDAVVSIQAGSEWDKTFKSRLENAKMAWKNACVHSTSLWSIGQCSFIVASDIEIAARRVVPKQFKEFVG